MNWENQICVIEDLNVIYQIIENCNEFVVLRASDSSTTQTGILGVYGEIIGVCVCLNVWNAIGLPPKSHCSGNIDYVKNLAEKDLINLRNGCDNVFITEFYKGNVT